MNLFGIGLPTRRTSGAHLAAKLSCSVIVVDIVPGHLFLLDDWLKQAALLPVDLGLEERGGPRFHCP